MDYAIAFEILEIQTDIDINKLNLNYLKKKYHRLALLNHPDKNGNTKESNEKFKKINEAYNYLKREIKYENDNTDLYEEDIHAFQSYDVNILLKLFINSFLDGKYSDIIKNLIADIINGCKKISIKLFEDIDKDKLLNIYTFLSKYKSTLGLKEEILEDIKKIVIQKYDNVLLYKLNPSISDLLNDNIYKLYIKNKLYLVPLWLNESYFENNENEIIVICEPELPENIKIDEYNNIYIDLKIDVEEIIKNILYKEDFSLDIADKRIIIPISHLYMKKEQIYKIKNEGLLKQDFMDINKIVNKNKNIRLDRTDIIINITLTNNVKNEIIK